MPGHDTRTRLAALLLDDLWPGLERAGLDVVEHDPARPSPCLVGEPARDGMIRWKPVPMERAADFTELQDALAQAGAALHPDVTALYGSFWCGPVEGMEHSGEPVALCTLWNEEELRHTVRALADHARRQAAQPCAGITFPVAGTGSDLFFVLDNATGAVLLQEAGHCGGRVVAPSLARFLAEL
ncbi:SecY-interacting protein Syd [Kitasatospora sp. NPDC058162]|uniref:SecY-interacting protein Syd n=1 Tax=Kitasatospora sp. NPDC058162 TaxID=3346362 RepID=UPI0036DCF27D